MTVPCQAIRDEIAFLKDEIRGRQGDLKDAPPSERPRITKAINKLKAELALNKEKLLTCVDRVRIQAIQIADDGGGRATPITTAQVKQWTDFANTVFDVARIQFLFNPDPNGHDWSTKNSTVLNNLLGPSPTALSLASQFPGKLVVLFRTGDPATPTGGCGPGRGCSGADWGYVVMPGFNTTFVCGHQNIGLLAHELGHYFGLAHTHAREFKNVDQADGFFMATRDPAAFDGDLGTVSDTPPDPFADDIQCVRTTTSVTLGGFQGIGVPFLLPRTNIMSYYDESTKTLSQGQIAVARANLAGRSLDLE